MENSAATWWAIQQQRNSARAGHNPVGLHLGLFLRGQVPRRSQKVGEQVIQHCLGSRDSDSLDAALSLKTAVHDKAAHETLDADTAEQLMEKATPNLHSCLCRQHFRYIPYKCPKVYSQHIGVTFHGWGKVGKGQEVRGTVTWQRSMHTAMMRPHHTIG